MKIKYDPCLWNSNAASYFPSRTLPDTEIKVVSENILQVDGELYEFPPDGVLCKNIFQQTDGVIEEVHRDDFGVLYVTVRRFFSSPGGELAWYSDDYVEVSI